MHLAEALWQARLRLTAVVLDLQTAMGSLKIWNLLNDSLDPDIARNFLTVDLLRFVPALADLIAPRLQRANPAEILVCANDEEAAALRHILVTLNIQPHDNEPHYYQVSLRAALRLTTLYLHGGRYRDPHFDLASWMDACTRLAIEWAGAEAEISTLIHDADFRRELLRRTQHPLIYGALVLEAGQLLAPRDPVSDADDPRPADLQPYAARLAEHLNTIWPATATVLTATAGQ